MRGVFIRNGARHNFFLLRIQETTEKRQNFPDGAVKKNKKRVDPTETDAVR